MSAGNVLSPIGTLFVTETLVTPGSPATRCSSVETNDADCSGV